MKHQKHAAAAAALCLLLTACGQTPTHYGTNSESNSTAPVQEQTVPVVIQSETTTAAQQEITETTAGSTAQTTASTAKTTTTPRQTQTTAPQTTAPPAAESKFAGKWQFESFEKETIEYGQYGSEYYAVLYQIEINADGTAVLHDRSSGDNISATWKEAGDGSISFSYQAEYGYFPLSFSDEKLYPGTDNDTLTGKDGAVVFRRTNQFRQPEHAAIYQLAGEWRTEKIIGYDGNTYTDGFGGAPMTNFSATIYAIGDTLVVWYGPVGEPSVQLYFANDEGSKRYTLRYEDLDEYPTMNWDYSEIYLENGKLIWDVQDGYIGQLVMAKEER